MDEMKISTRLMKRLIAKLVKKAINRKLGYDVDIQLNDLVIVNDDAKARVHLDADVKSDREELSKILKNTGLT